MAEQRDIVIVGGGPAGTGTALALHRSSPELARRALVIDRAEFPRDKTCAGGLIPHTLALLSDLEVPFSIPAVQVDRARVDAGGPRIEMESPGCCWVIRRREFDAMLLDAVVERGIEVRTGVRLREATRRGDRIVLETSGGTIEARAVVAADGAGSLLRRRLVCSEEGWLARAVMADVPLDGDRPPDAYQFDFTDVPAGLAGYAWSFPCWIDGKPHFNVGAYSLDRRGEGGRLADILDRRGAGRERKAHPIRLYRAEAPLSAPGVLLVGDSAGVDPLLGEGISYALEYGALAARELARGFAVGDLAFDGYTAGVAQSSLGRKLQRLSLAARLFYGPRSRLFFGLARLSRTAQRIGMNWYNGVGLWNPPVMALPSSRPESSTQVPA